MENTNTDGWEIKNSFILDVNILFSGVLSQKEVYRKLFLEYTLYTPDFALIELNKYRELILRKAKKIPIIAFRSFSLFIFSKIIVVPDYLISNESYHKAEKLVEFIDPKDVAYVALAEELGSVLLTRDKVLHDGLKAQGFERIKLFQDFVRESMPLVL